MVYRISGTIIFREEDGALWNIEHPDDVLVLSSTACRVFTLLLQNPGSVVEREILFRKIWDQFGLHSSNNSLNQQISLIRRNVKLLGCEDEVIQTIPKVGFFIPSQLVEGENTGLELYNQQVQTVPTTTISGETSADAPSIKRKKKLFDLEMLTFLILVIACICIATVAIKKRINDKVPNSSLFLMGKSGDCNVYSLNETPNSLKERSMEVFNKLKYKLPCIQGGIYIFQIDNGYLLKRKGHLYLSHCIYKEKNYMKIEGCTNVYSDEN
jgi:DNA-binding winged helix-turn-helix (wHTH) protein